jgi:RNA 3'-terminal phosphate cyclase (ATP)
MLVIDGSQGEGGGQVLRSSLSLAMLTGQSLCIENIRAGREKPGLLRQHLTAVQAAVEICGATCDGAHLGSTMLTFAPAEVKAGDYHFAIGSAGASCLVFQTVFLPLAKLNMPSRVTIQGGTHNTMAPSFEYLDRVFLPLARRMGFNAKLNLHRHGFYPAGGGKITAEISPFNSASPFVLEERGKLVSRKASALFANLPAEIALREIKELKKSLHLEDHETTPLQVDADGPGNILMFEVMHEHVTEIFSAHGEMRVSAEQVAHKVSRAAEKYLDVPAAIGPHLADQLLLPMALTGGGHFTTLRATPHTITNAAIIEKFLPVEISIEEPSSQLRLLKMMV